MEFTVPPEVNEGDYFNLTGSGFIAYAPFIRVNVSYPNRAETMKVQVADADVVAKDPRFTVGDISLTLYADQAGEVGVVLWSWDQREKLGSAKMVVIARGR